MCDLYELTINGETIYYVDGYFYSIDTIDVVSLFDNISI